MVINLFGIFKQKRKIIVLFSTIYCIIQKKIVPLQAEIILDVVGNV